MDLDQIQELLKLMEKHGLGELELEGVTETDLEPIRDAWVDDLGPLLENPVGPKEPLHIDQVVVAGRAQAKAFAKLLALPGLSEKARNAILQSAGWYVPRLVKSAE